VNALERVLEDVALLPADDELAQAPWEEHYTFPLDFASRLGQRTAELHLALATDTPDPAFAREVVTKDDVAAWAEATRQEAAKAFNALSRLPDTISEHVKAGIEHLMAQRANVDRRIDQFASAQPSGFKTRIHGDFHLGQVMLSGDDAVIIDFEGEPRRPLEERRAKTSPMRDVAGMLRSFDYAAWAALDNMSSLTPEPPAHVIEAAREWHRRAHHDFLENYEAIAKTSPTHPSDKAVAKAQLDMFLLQKALYEITYEASSRPAWIAIPLRGVLDLIAERSDKS